MMDNADDSRLSADEWHCRWRPILQATSTIGIVIFSCVMISIGFDIHAMRLNQAGDLSAIRAGAFSRIDSLLWKLDTLTTVASATNKALANGLLQVQVQVKQSSEDQSANLKATQKATTAAVRQSIESTSQVLQKVAAVEPPVVNVQVPKLAPAVAPIVVTAPAPAAAPTVVAPTPRRQDSVQHYGWFRWFRFLGMVRHGRKSP